MIYVAVHGGAGFHGYENEKEVKKSLQQSCRKVLLPSNDTAVYSSSISIVEEAITSLENDEGLNAGYGSNLTVTGGVECDASIMDGKMGSFGSVGAVSGIKNPIRLARSILDYSKKGGKLGRIPPLTLVAEGARSFATTRLKSDQLVSPESLVSRGALFRWQKWKQCLDTSEDVYLIPKDGVHLEDASYNDIQDTVGAVAYHQKDGVAAGVSSGGILLKLPGRIGEAAVYGAGCWAQEQSPKHAMSCSISGTGEYIIRANLARKIGDLFKNAWRDHPEDIDAHEILTRVIVDEFWQPARQHGELEPSVGVLLLTREEDIGSTKVRLWCAFTTRSMAIAYASSENPKPKAMILRRPNQHNTTEVPVFITAISL